MSDDFKVAANRAAMRFPAGLWERMSTHEQANAIYEELRALDMERAKKLGPRMDFSSILNRN